VFNLESLVHSDPSVYEIESILREWTNVWFKKYDECEKRKITHNLMGYFKNILNLKNVIVENRASIDEIKELKKSTISKILQGNSLLGLDVIAFDSNYNRLDTSEATTTLLYEELKKNSEIKGQSVRHANNSIQPSISIDESSLTHFDHKSPQTNPINASSRSSATYCLKITLENLIPFNCPNYFDDKTQETELCANLYLYKEHPADSSYYLCENAYFNMSQISSLNRMSGLNGTHSSSSNRNDSQTSSVTISQNSNKNFALFCDISEKDFELTKTPSGGFRLFLVVYAIRHSKKHPTDQHASISRIFAGGICDLGSNFCNLVYVSTEVRNIQASMCLSITDFDTSIVTPKTIQEFINANKQQDSINDSYNKIGPAKASSSSTSTHKDSYLTLTFRSELSELTFKQVSDKYSNCQPKICRKMDFPEIIMPDDFRNDFYVTVCGGEFQKARNYEFVVNLVQFREDNSKFIEVPVDFID
jgi:hypothetical protein